MSMFDPNLLLNSAIDGELATRRDPLPAGETTGQIVKVETATGISGPKSSNPGKPWYKLNVTIEMNDPAYLARATREKATITYGVMLDLTEQGAVAMGPNKNVQLGKLRAATGTNQPGKSLQDMNGRFIRLVIGHRPDDNDASIVYDEVKTVAAV